MTKKTVVRKQLLQALSQSDKSSTMLPNVETNVAKSNNSAVPEVEGEKALPVVGKKDQMPKENVETDPDNPYPNIKDDNEASDAVHTRNNDNTDNVKSDDVPNEPPG